MQTNDTCSSTGGGREGDGGPTDNPWAPWSEVESAHEHDGEEPFTWASSEVWAPRLLVIALVIGAIAGVEAMVAHDRGVAVEQVGS